MLVLKETHLNWVRDCSAARSGDMMTFILDFAKSLAVVLPWSNGSTSDV